MNPFSFAHLVGALCFYLFGLHLTSQGFRQASGDRLRSRVERFTRNRVIAFFFGALMAIVFQSSAATIVMLVGLAGIGFIEPRRAAPAVLGADFGTTLKIVVLAAFVRYSMMDAALTVLILGFAATFLFRRNRGKFYSEGLLGLGFIFYGLSLFQAMGIAMKDSASVQLVVASIAQNPIPSLIFATLFAALLQGSTAMIGILLSLVATGVMNFEQSIPFILGANLGSAVGPVLVGFRSKTEGRRLAVFHAATNLFGAMILFPFASVLAAAVSEHVVTPPYQVATVHILFNSLLAVLFLPTLGWVTQWIKSSVPPTANSQKFGAQYLDIHALDTPSLAFANVFREILRMAEVVQEMCSQVLISFEEVGGDTEDRLQEMDDQVDTLDREIKFYLAKMNQTQLTEVQAGRQLELLMITHDLESIGDVVTKDLLELAEKKRRKQVSFSQEGWNEIREFHRKVMENFHLAVTSFATGEIELGQKVMRHKKKLAKEEEELGQAHLRRLNQGLKESFDTSSIHLDLLTNLRRINSIVAKMAYPVLDRRQ